jgi:hypothetical protein
VKSDILTRATWLHTAPGGDEGERRVHGGTAGTARICEGLSARCGVRHVIIGCSKLLPRVIIGYLDRFTGIWNRDAMKPWPLRPSTARRAFASLVPWPGVKTGRGAMWICRWTPAWFSGAKAQHQVTVRRVEIEAKLLNKKGCRGVQGATDSLLKPGDSPLGSPESRAL